MNRHSPLRPRWMCAVPIFVWPLIGAQPVAAQSTQGALVVTIIPAGSRAAKAERGAPAPAPAKITVGRDGDIVGQPVRFSRTVFGAVAARPAPDAPRSMPAGLPIAGRLTSSFGMRLHPILGDWRPHFGVDLAAPAGTPVLATSDGVVTRAAWAGGYGLMVELAGAGGMSTRFGHLSRMAVGEGQSVRKGDVIGFVGSTGLSTGPHLHYEVRRNGRAVDPFAATP